MRKPVIAVVGVSRDKNKYGYKVFRNLLNKGYEVKGVNPHAKEIDGYKIYSSASSVSADVVVFVVKPEVAFDVLKKIRKKDVYFWFQPGSESKEAIEYCRNNNLRCVFHRCIMKDTDRGRLVLTDDGLELV